MYGWATEMQGEVSKLVETQVADINKNVVEAIDRAAKSAPTGSEFAFAALKSALTAANQAYDVMSKAGKQVAAYTENTLSTAVTTAEATPLRVSAPPNSKHKAAPNFSKGPAQGPFFLVACSAPGLAPSPW